MFASSLAVVASGFYALACALYITFLLREGRALERWATGSLGLAGLAHGLFLAIHLVSSHTWSLNSIHTLFGSASLLTIVAYLLARRWYRIGVLGVFVAPISFALFLAAGLAGFRPNLATGQSALISWHVLINLVGVASLTLAFATALGYVIQEHLLRTRRLQGLFRRLPSLEVLDTLMFRFVAVGFGLLTVGLLTGIGWWMARSPRADIGVSQVIALVAWAIFAGVLSLRLGAGWRGRRSAWGTICGFACAALVLVGYALRASGSAL